MFRSINTQSIALGASSRCEPTVTDVPVYVIWRSLKGSQRFAEATTVMRHVGATYQLLPRRLGAPADLEM
jgi:hypothetical protein